eukprot:4653480-Pleurochrysis_carterae.AAC.1
MRPEDLLAQSIRVWQAPFHAYFMPATSAKKNGMQYKTTTWSTASAVSRVMNFGRSIQIVLSSRLC